MEKLKCSVCGAPLTQKSKTQYVCEFCDNVFNVKEEIPADTIIKMNIAGNELRNLAFPRAKKAYGDIAERGVNIAEVFWCIVLCKYGIEYVKDERTGKFIPTMHRMSTVSVFDDPDYQKALQYAEKKEDYEKKAEEIENIRLKILSVAETQKPVEIFICYKQEDGNGRPTEESLFVTDLYNMLKGRGAEVFLARKCIPAGEDYEPHIFHALESAKVMLLMCSKIEYVNARWVENEWDRFADMILFGQNKKLIPIFDSGFNPYDMPDKLSSMRLQGLSRGSLSFAEDLISAIEQTIGRKLNDKQSKADEQKAKLDQKKKLDAAELALKIHNYAKAQDKFEEYVENYSMDSRGWFGLARVYTKEFTDLNADEVYLEFIQNALNVVTDEEEKRMMEEKCNAFSAKKEVAEQTKRTKEEEEERKAAESEQRKKEEEEKKAAEKERFAREKREEEQRLAEIEWEKRELERKLAMEKARLEAEKTEEIEREKREAQRKLAEEKLKIDAEKAELKAEKEHFSQEKKKKAKEEKEKEAILFGQQILSRYGVEKDDDSVEKGKPVILDENFRNKFDDDDDVAFLRGARNREKKKEEDIVIINPGLNRLLKDDFAFLQGFDSSKGKDSVAPVNSNLRMLMEDDDDLAFLSGAQRKGSGMNDAELTFIKANLKDEKNKKKKR